jgi:hypothetical protein
VVVTFDGVGKPEPLKNLAPNTWSRRLTQEHRIVYLVSEVHIDFPKRVTITDLVIAQIFARCVRLFFVAAATKNKLECFLFQFRHQFIPQLNHSPRNATIGSTFVARRAGR